MGIAGVEPRQLAPTVGTTGSGSTDSPAPSSTNAKIDIDTTIDTIVGIAVPTVIDTNAKIDIDTTIDTVVGIAVSTVIDTNAKIDINSTINTTVGIAVPAIIDTNPSEPEVDIAGSTVIDTASPSTTDLTPATIIIDPTSGMAGAASTVTGGFDMAFGLFNFHVDSDGVTELISVSCRGQSPDDRATGAIGGGIKAENLDPVSQVERLRRTTSIPNHRLLRRLQRVPLRGRRRFLVSRDRRLRRSSGRHYGCLPDDIRVRAGSQCPHAPYCAL
jgi:hypothetical protein